MLLAREVEPYANLPEDVKPAILALSILVGRIGTLPKADRDDLFELLQAWRDVESEAERRSIQRAMEEILAQIPARTKPLPAGATPPEVTKRWRGHVGKTIRELRDGAGLSQAQLAKKAGLTQSHISRLENGEHHAANFTLEKIARALDVPVGRIDPCLAG